MLELSSFQLETTSSLAATAACVLNVTDNHLDRYADIDAYAAAKARIFLGGGIQVLNRDDPRSLAMRVPGRLVQTFGAGVPDSEEAWGLVNRGAGRDGAQETWLARGGALLAPVSDLRLVGRHNALNALAALALASAVAKVDRSVLAALTAFEGLPHRMQRIAEAAGVLYVDDSKGTTVAATRVALEGLGRPVVLIAGGDGKGQDFRPLRAAVDAHCRAVLLIGRDAPALFRALSGTKAAVEQVGNARAGRRARRGRSRGRATRSCSRRRARASTSSPITSSAANGMPGRCVRTSRGRRPSMRDAVAADCVAAVRRAEGVRARSARCRAIRGRCSSATCRSPGPRFCCSPSVS